ncbi:hypothetical protein T4D_12984 [Trichinella pseudospiralis]|uniref:Uncharacterized protein n=1 Tax=Trichinella pseudospiralis TaxID=6337 RepID=A0A0V1FRT7_TRIPS|nr:hypothetical protein T4D_12984 [Trichinella pseudospiralis]
MTSNTTAHHFTVHLLASLVTISTLVRITLKRLARTFRMNRRHFISKGHSFVKIYQQHVFIKQMAIQILTNHTSALQMHDDKRLLFKNYTHNCTCFTQ